MTKHRGQITGEWIDADIGEIQRRRVAPASPDRGYSEQAAERIGGHRACLSVARKLLKRSYHTLRELGARR